MERIPNGDRLRLALPKGRMQTALFQLLAEAGIHVRASGRGYRPSISLPNVDAKLLKPQNVVEMLHAGSRDAGFTGADWVAELDAELVEMLDTGLDPVRMVAAAPIALLEDGRLPDRPLVVASEYEQLAGRWIREQGIDATLVRSYGATEVFPPEDADVIVDITQTGATLRENRLAIVDELLTSSTRLYVHPGVLQDGKRRDEIDQMVLLLRSVLEARRRVLLEVNVTAENLESVIEVVPAMKEPTISQLHGSGGYAIKAAVPREDLPKVIPAVKARGGTDIVVSALAQIVP